MVPYLLESAGVSESFYSWKVLNGIHRITGIPFAHCISIQARRQHHPDDGRLIFGKMVWNGKTAWERSGGKGLARQAGSFFQFISIQKRRAL
jgi:hypothetical protein